MMISMYYTVVEKVEKAEKVVKVELDEEERRMESLWRAICR